MINLSKLINLLPFYFKDKDTYKDENDEGILERFLDICGLYFRDDVKPDIDNLLDYIDSDKAHPMILNHIWEFLGSIPYAYGAIYDGGSWDKYKDKELNREIWEQEIINNSPRAYSRDILKYVISLYKIRGTLSFYDMLLRFYGMSCIVDDPTGDLQDPNSTIQSLDIYPVYYDEEDTIQGNPISYDEDPLNMWYYDENDKSNCTTCIEVHLQITVDSSINITDEMVERTLLLLNRFRPIHVKEFDVTNTSFTNNDGFTYVFNFNVS